ncbi:hypothetical protein [Leifsonia sp. NPDC058248]|uniref:hypothetical protein n=1 Tax=Leifsonia sp. NPDC058248 TaxID=3346402 RepID=UPI0036D7E70B
METHRRSPAYRSIDPAERALAGWAAKQRHARRHGRLSPAREAALERIPIWAWGSLSESEEP